jgi:hypothetical protein
MEANPMRHTEHRTPAWLAEVEQLVAELFDAGPPEPPDPPALSRVAKRAAKTAWAWLERAMQAMAWEAWYAQG